MRVFEQATGRPHPSPPYRPRWHTFPTFESSLPLGFCASAVKFDPREAADGRARGPAPKLDMRCIFCPGVKAFAGVVAYWSHLVHKHPDVDDGSRLAEARRAAMMWKGYCKVPVKSTLVKMQQLLDPAWTWAGVVGWDLR